MSTPDPVLSTLIFVFALQAMVLSVLLVLKKPRRESNLFLALLVFFFALMAFNIALINALISRDAFYIFRYVQLELLYGMGPALFLYTKSITNSSFRFSKADYLHFVPVILEFIFYRTAFYRLGADGMYTTPPHPYTKIYIAEQWLGILSITTYTILSLRLLVNHNRLLKQHYSNLERRSAAWLKVPVIFYTSYWIAWNILTEIDRFAFDRTLRDTYFLPAFAGLAIASCWIGFKGYITSQEPSALSSPSLKEGAKVDPKLGDKITQLMRKERPFLDPELDLMALSKLLNVKPKQVSAAINQNFGQNFYEYVNHHRVEAFKERIDQPDTERLTLLGHAFESGFSSKSTFNDVFKRKVGLTPSAYVKQVKNKSE